MPKVETAQTAEPDFPVALHPAELAQEVWSQARFRKFLGEIAAESSVEMPTAHKKTSLGEALLETHRGSNEAESLVDINVGSAVSEACFKEEHVTSIEMQQNEDGELMQFGLTVPQMHHNSITLRPGRHPLLQNVTRSEALNGHRIQDLFRAGILKDYWYVVPSLVPEGVPEKNLGEDGDGYFLRSLTYVSQGTTQEGEKVITQSGFNRGVEEKEGEHLHFQERMDRRHDLHAVQRVYKRLGLPAPKSTDEALEGILIHKSVMKNGIVDFMRMCDEETDKILGRIVPRTEEQYTDLWRKSREREESMATTKQKVKAELLSKAHLFRPNSDDANRALGEITRKYTVEAAKDNQHIDLMVLGSEAAHKVAIARYRQQIGDYAGMRLAMDEAQEVAVITMCGGGSRASKSRKTEVNNGEVSPEDKAEIDTNKDDTEESDEEDEIPAFLRCLRCKVSSPKEKVIRPNTWCCPKCDYEIDICTGEVINEGRPLKNAA